MVAKRDLVDAEDEDVDDEPLVKPKQKMVKKVKVQEARHHSSEEDSSKKKKRNRQKTDKEQNSIKNLLSPACDLPPGCRRVVTSKGRELVTAGGLRLTSQVAVDLYTSLHGMPRFSVSWDFTDKDGGEQNGKKQSESKVAQQSEDMGEQEQHRGVKLGGGAFPSSHLALRKAHAVLAHKNVTGYIPIRRSERKPKAELLKEQMEGIEARLLSTDDSALDIEISDIVNKGCGILALRDFKKGEFVVEYAGDLINIDDAKEREAKYSMDVSKGCYMYYFKSKGKQYCIDATGESGRYGRLLNHSTKTPNCATKVVMLGDVPRLILVAKQDIAAQTELLYDYGDRSKESLKAHPWLAL